jgi:hypothetical protein
VDIFGPMVGSVKLLEGIMHGACFQLERR